MQQKVESVLYTLLPHNAFPKPILQLVLKYMFYGEEAEVQLVHSRFGKKLKRDSTFTIGDKIEFTCPYLNEQTRFLMIEERYLTILYSRFHIVVYNYALKQLQFVGEGDGFYHIAYDSKEKVLVVERQSMLETYSLTDSDLERQATLWLEFDKSVTLYGLVFCFFGNTVTVYETKELCLRSQHTFESSVWHAFVYDGLLVVSFLNQPDLQYDRKEGYWIPMKEKIQMEWIIRVWI